MKRSIVRYNPRLTRGRWLRWAARAGLLLTGGGAGDPTAPAHRHDAALPHRFVDRADGVAVRYPAGWRVDQRPLTRLMSPRQLLVVSSFPIRQRRPDPNCTPKTAVSELPPTGVLLLLFGQRSNSSRSTGHHPIRTPHFHLEDLAAQPYECFGTSREVDFRSAGQQLYLLAYFGPRATRHTKQLADQTLDSLVLHAPPSLERHG